MRVRVAGGTSRTPAGLFHTPDTGHPAQLETAMMRLKHSRFVLLLTAAAAVTALGTGCATSSQAQRGQWSRQDERAYREYLSEQHLPYQDFSLLGGEQQNAYLMWRHAHPDVGNSAAGS